MRYPRVLTSDHSLGTAPATGQAGAFGGFGQTNQQQQPAAAGPGLFGQTQQQQQQQQPATGFTGFGESCVKAHLLIS